MGNSVSAPSSSSATASTGKYDVFISFRGEDTRNNFTSHLHTALCRKQIHTFIDDGLEKGDDIWLNLSKSIRESKISVVIFSKDYASSKWCLRELVAIMECKEKKGQTVIPVFYQVDPSHVRKQKESFEDSFVEHEKQVQEEVPKWRKALTDASNLSGWDSSVTKPDAKLVKEIVRDIEKKLRSGGDIWSPDDFKGIEQVTWSPDDFKGLIGLHERIEQVMSLLSLDKANDIRIIGIWGMGGVGKTTISNVIYNKISHQFEGNCFIRDVRGRLEKNEGSVLSLQEEFLSKVLSNQENLKLDGTTFSKNIKKILSKRKVFIVLDDVDDFIKLEELAGGLDQFASGSRIMITSRDKQVLENCTGNAHRIYEVKGFKLPEALTHFCNFAFRKNHPTDELRKSSFRIVNYTKGNPLALKVLGSSLFRKSKVLWKSAIANLQENFKENFKGQIFDVLKISYDRLDKEEKNMFLDIACFFKGNNKEDIAKIYGDSSSYLLSVLEDKSLIKVLSHGRIDMHDLLQEMGREIVERESNWPGNRSRLWRHRDVLGTLKNGDGTDAVPGIDLYIDMIVEDIYLSHQTFEKMKSLKFLKFWTYHYNSESWGKLHCPNGLSYLSNQMISLNWLRCPLKVLPPNFIPNYHLIELDLSYSNLEMLVEDSMFVPKLKWLILKGCQRLTSISKRLHAPLLEKIDLENCVELLDFPSVDGHGLKRLHELNLYDCKELKQLPSTIHCGSLRSLNLGGCINLTRISDLSMAPLLVNLNLTNCVSLAAFPRLAQHLQEFDNLSVIGCTNITTIPGEVHFGSFHFVDLQGCNNLTTFPLFTGNIMVLNMSGTAIGEVPSSIQKLTRLYELNLSKCTRLERISTDICKLKSLERLILKDCFKLESFPNILEKMERLKFLHLSGTAIKELPNSIGKMTRLLILNLRKCENLEMLPDNICNLMSLAKLDLSDCSNLKTLWEKSTNLNSLVDLSAGRVTTRQPPNATTHMDNLGSSSILSQLENHFKILLERRCESLRGAINDRAYLYLDNCNMLQSLTDLPSTLQYLSAVDCKQLRSIPDPYKFAVLDEAEFIFTNCLNLEKTMVINILKRAIKEYMQKDFNASFQAKKNYFCRTKISICCPGGEVPQLFNYQSEKSFIQVQTKLRNFEKGELVGFAVCAVIEFKEYHFRGNYPLKVLYECRCDDGEENSPNRIMDAFQARIDISKGSITVVSRNETLIDSDHVALSFFARNETLIDSDQVALSFFGWEAKRVYTNFLFKFQLSEKSCHCRVKSCGVYPIYQKRSMTLPSTSKENFGATAQDFGEMPVEVDNKIRKFPGEAETSGGSNEDAMEPQFKRTHCLPDPSS